MIASEPFPKSQNDHRVLFIYFESVIANENLEAKSLFIQV